MKYKWSLPRIKRNRKEIPNTAHIFNGTVSGSKLIGQKQYENYQVNKMEDFHSTKI